MRTFIDQTGGIATVDQVGDDDTETSITQNAKQILDVSAFWALDIELRVYSLSQTATTSATSALLYLETSMQVDDVQTSSLWDPLDPAGLNLLDFDGTNRASNRSRLAGSSGSG